MVWKPDRGIIERMCIHGVGHPDPDSLTYLHGRDDGVHGCCGCCASPEQQREDVVVSKRHLGDFREPSEKDPVTLTEYLVLVRASSNYPWTEMPNYVYPTLSKALEVFGQYSMVTLNPKHQYRIVRRTWTETPEVDVTVVELEMEND